ncbi:hypothetical protein GF314_05060 [bacterium]|nr:hypothetical protein [bacterium]
MTLTLPEPKAVLDLLAMFIGDRPPLAPGQAPDLARTSYGTYVCWLQGADGNVEGAFLVDLAAALYIGGGLIMMPEASLVEQFKTGQVSEAVLDGLSEIFNNLRGQLNRIDLNPHVTPTDAVPYQPPAEGASEAWVYEPRGRIDLTGMTAFGIGTLTLLAR